MATQTRSSAQHQLDIILEVFRHLGIPIAEEKDRRLTKFLIFLGIALDTLLLEGHSPDDNLAELK